RLGWETSCPFSATSFRLLRVRLLEIRERLGRISLRRAEQPRMDGYSGSASCVSAGPTEWGRIRRFTCGRGRAPVDPPPEVFDRESGGGHSPLCCSSRPGNRPHLCG